MDARIRALGGVVRSATLRASGVSGRELTDAVRSGRLLRPRRGWLAVPDADPALVYAARYAVTLTCVTRASRLGLWVLDSSTPHVAPPTNSSDVRVPGAVVHWRSPLIPRPPGCLEDPIEDTLVCVSLCQPFESALAVWESALRSDRVDVRAMGRLRLPKVARALLEVASPWSDSGLETFVVPRLRWLRLPLRRQVWILGHRVDLLIGERLVLQIDGGTHVGEQRERDIRHDALLTLHGYHVIRVGYRDVVHGWPALQEVLMRAIAQGLHLAR